jgi:all-trans-retinol dehydrogenase (NAD+)
MTQIAGQVVVITGGASGIGRLMARGFAARGATVAVLDLDADGARATAKELEAQTGRPHHAYAVDVTDRAAVYEVADALRRDAGDPGVVVNNAGVISGGAPLVDTPDEWIDLTIDVNTKALFWVTKAFLPAMIRRDAGHVVTIGSASGMVGVSRLVEYAASKHAAIGFDESLRMELKELAPGVRTTIVNPYYISTGMFDGVTTRWPWLLPILEPQAVADRVVDAVARDRARVVMPPAVGLLPPLRVLPVRAFDAVIGLLGVNQTMKTFTGRGRTTAADVVDEVAGGSAAELSAGATAGG